MFSYILLNLQRNMKKNILISLITAFFILFLILYENTLVNTKEELENIYDTTIVTGNFVEKEQQNGSLKIHYNLVKQILETGFVESYDANTYITASSVNPQVYFPIGIPEEQWPSVIGLTEEVLNGLHDENVNYVSPYNSSIWNGTDRVCLVSTQIMDEFHIGYGDEIQLGALMFDVGVWEEKLKKNTYTVIGSFDGSMDIGAYLQSYDIVVPYQTYMMDIKNYFNDKLSEGQLKNYMSVEDVTFVLKDTRKLNELRGMLNKMSFKKNANYSSESIYYNINFKINDEELNQKITPLHNTINMMENGKLFMYGIISIIGILIAYLVYQSYKREKELMIILGQSPWSTYRALLGYMIIAPFVTIVVLYVITILIDKKPDGYIWIYFFISYFIGYHIAYGMDYIGVRKR